jgi:hypothetical protein
MKKSARLRLDARNSALWSCAAIAAASMFAILAYNFRLYEFYGSMMLSSLAMLFAIFGAIFKAVQFQDYSCAADREEYWEERRISIRYGNCERI